MERYGKRRGPGTRCRSAALWRVRRPRSPPRRVLLGSFCRKVGQRVASGADWLFGLFSLVVGLSVLAALPVAQFLSLGYFLESSARVARTGRLRDGLIGVRRAARIGGVVLGSLLSLLPLWLAGSYAQSAELIDPGGTVAHRWRVVLAVVTALTFIQHHRRPVREADACGISSGRWASVLAGPRDSDQGGFTPEPATASGSSSPRSGCLITSGWGLSASWARWPGWSCRPSLIAASGRFPSSGFLGALLLAFVAPSLPFLQVRYAVEGRVSALFSLRSIRERFRRAPWAFAFALMVLLAGGRSALPLEDRDDPPRSGLAAERRLRRSSLPRRTCWSAGPTPAHGGATARATGLSAPWAGSPSSRSLSSTCWSSSWPSTPHGAASGACTNSTPSCCQSRS